MYPVLSLMKTRSIDVYSPQKSFSVILILVVTFTFVIFGHIQCQKNVMFTVFSFRHLYSVILTSLTLLFKLDNGTYIRHELWVEVIIETFLGAVSYKLDSRFGILNWRLKDAFYWPLKTTLNAVCYKT